jgi:MFS family permease
VSVLRDSRDFRSLWSARLISFVGDALALVALIVYVAKHHDEGFAVAALLLAGDLAPTLASPWTATLADRIDLRALMVWCELAQGIVVVLLVAAIGSLPLVLLLVVIRGVVAHTFLPASRSAVPRLVADDALDAANSLLGLGTFGLEAVGAALAAALLPLVGTRGALALDAATFVCSAFLLSRLPSMPHPATIRTSVHRDALEGLRTLLRDRVVRVVALGFAAFVACTAMDDVALAFLGQGVLHSGDGGTALLYAGSGIGLFAGFVVLARRRRGAPAAVFVAGLAIASFGNVLTGVAWASYAALGFQAVRGLGVSAVDVGSSTLLQRTVSADRLGRVFGNLYGLVGFAAGISYLAGGVLLHTMSARTVLVIAGSGGLLAAAGTGFGLFGSHPTEIDRAER